MFLIVYGVPILEYPLVSKEMDYVDWLKLNQDTLEIRPTQPWVVGPSHARLGIYAKEDMCTKEKFLGYSKDNGSKLKISVY